MWDKRRGRTWSRTKIESVIIRKVKKEKIIKIMKGYKDKRKNRSKMFVT